MNDPTLFLLDGLSSEEIARCYQSARVEERSFKKGDVICAPGDAPRYLAFVLEGHLRVVYGRVVMNDLYSGEVFGAAALYGSSEEYPSTIVAVTDGRMQLISQDTVSRWMTLMPRVGENYVRFLSDRIRFLNRRLTTLTAGQTDGKLWRYLMAHRNDDGVVLLSGGMSELAERLDMGRSSLYRSLDALTSAGRIRRDGKKIFILQTEE